MTIVEAITAVLSGSSDAMTSKAIYDKIVEQKLYSFGAKDPAHVVNSEIRKRCRGLEFPTAYPIKVFEIAGFAGKKPVFKLLNSEMSSLQNNAVLNTRGREDALPEEKIGNALEEHIDSIKQQVLDCVMKNSPAFFEQMVLDLLLKMGYGFGKESGIVTGRSHDGGIDGVISEDKLGLDVIYIQAKKYAANNKVGRKELQAFVGAMQDVQKGVFITTSAFTPEASKFVAGQQQKRIKLIDGTLLAKLLVEYEIGVTRAQTFSIYKVDYDYYEG